MARGCVILFMTVAKLDPTAVVNPVAAAKKKENCPNGGKMKFRHRLDADLVCHQAPPQQQPQLRPHVNISAYYQDFLRDCKPRGSGKTTRSVSTCRFVVAPAESADAEVSLSQMEQCVVDDADYTGEYFTILITHTDPARTNAYVGYTGNPFLDIYRYNAKHADDGDDETDRYRLAVVIGPHVCKSAAQDLGLSWVTYTRGADSKFEKSEWLSQAYNRPLYSCRHRPDGELAPLLAEYADPAFLTVQSEIH